MRKLTRERQQLIKERARCKNQAHAEKHSPEPLKATLKRYEKHITFLNGQIKTIEKEIKHLISKDEFVASKVDKTTTIPGISYITVAIVIAETAGFANLKSISQLTSYAGYDIVHKESGNWTGKCRISKKGNSHIRQALYMPTLSTITHTDTYGSCYSRLNAKKQNGMITSVAVQRKLLGLIYTLWKTDEIYVDNYESRRALNFG